MRRSRDGIVSPRERVRDLQPHCLRRIRIYPARAGQENVKHAQIPETGAEDHCGLQRETGEHSSSLPAAGSLMMAFWRLIRYAAYRARLLRLTTVTITEQGALLDERGARIGALPQFILAPLRSASASA